jgi:hypothetical protein
MQPIPPADSRGDEFSQRNIAVIDSGDAYLGEPDTQVEVSWLGAAAFLEQINDVRRLTMPEPGIETEPVAPVRSRFLRGVDELPSVDGTAAEAAYRGVKVCHFQGDHFRGAVVPPPHTQRRGNPAHLVDRDHHAAIGSGHPIRWQAEHIEQQADTPRRRVDADRGPRRLVQGNIEPIPLVLADRCPRHEAMIRTRWQLVTPFTCRHEAEPAS